MSVSPIVKLLCEGEGNIITCELKSGEVFSKTTFRPLHLLNSSQLFRGTLMHAEDNMNVQLKGVSHTAKDGKVTSLEQAFLRGSKIRFIVLPDMLKNAPMFQAIQTQKAGITSGRGRGTGFGMSQAVNSQRGGPRGARGGPGRGRGGGRGAPGGDRGGRGGGGGGF